MGRRRCSFAIRSVKCIFSRPPAKTVLAVLFGLPCACTEPYLQPYAIRTLLTTLCHQKLTYNPIPSEPFLQPYTILYPTPETHKFQVKDSMAASSAEGWLYDRLGVEAHPKEPRGQGFMVKRYGLIGLSMQASHMPQISEGALLRCWTGVLERSPKPRTVQGSSVPFCF